MLNTNYSPFQFNIKLKRKLALINNRLHWQSITLFILLVWNLGLTYFIIPEPTQSVNLPENYMITRLDEIPAELMED